MSSRRDERKARTRRAVLAAARTCFAEGGLAATSTQAVSAAAGISHGTLFLHFPRREQLIDQVVADLSAEIAAELEAPVLRLEAELDLQLRVILHEERLLAHLLREEAVLPKAARERLAELDRRLVQRLAAAYVAERGRLGLRALTPRLVGATWLALVQRVLRQGEADSRGFSALARWGPEIRAHLLDLVAP